PHGSHAAEWAPLSDPKKAGKQEFTGLGVHPTRPTLTPKFTIEKVGEDKITRNGVEPRLGRFRVRLRASTVTVWVLPGARVCRILPEGKGAVPVVLEGYEAATRGLK